MTRPSIFDLGDRLEQLDVPTLIMTGDEDEQCLEPALFMKRKIPRALGLVVLPKSGHTINLEEPYSVPTGPCWTSSPLVYVGALPATRTPPRRWPLRPPCSTS